MLEISHLLTAEYAIAVLSVLVAVAALGFATGILLKGRRSRPKQKSVTWKKELLESSKNYQTVDEVLAFDDVWTERQKRGVAPASLHHKGGVGEAKPFSSSYYYAHNNPQTKGGYSDGLRMEDFTMNQPRLLAKGGQAIESSLSQRSSESNTQGVLEPAVNNVSQKERRVIPITKYLWDDPGDSTGIGTIRIEHLQSLTTAGSENMIEWNDVKVVQIKSALQGGGLVVTVATDSVDYRLTIAKLYGPVSDVKATVVKANKRLLVRLHKKTSLFDKSNLKAWPHPQKKVV